MRTLVANYRDWLDLGPGGLPANPIGWTITTALRPFGRDPMTVRGVGAASQWELPPRPGSRPPVAPFPIPHRQTTDTASDELIAEIADVVSRYGTDDRMHLSRSHFERRGDALYVNEGVLTAERVVRARGEIAHVHSGDGSLHVVADPADARLIIDQGWGELHPLAGRPLLGLPESYVLLYSPRSEYDIRQLTRIVERVVFTALQS